MTTQSKNAGKNVSLRILVECGLMIAAAFVLSLIPIYQMPYGGKVTLFSMAPIMIIALRHGTKWGLGCGFVYSCIKLIFGLSDVMYVSGALAVTLCILLDYTFAFTALGLSGLFNNAKLIKDEKKNKLVTTTAGVSLAVTLRFLCHLVSGAVVWYTLTKGWETDAGHIVNRYGMWMYSFLYNATYMLPELILCVIAVPVLVKLLAQIDKISAK
jgi:putative proton-coupled thiamine transporter YuaJ